MSLIRGIVRLRPSIRPAVRPSVPRFLFGEYGFESAVAGDYDGAHFGHQICDDIANDGQEKFAPINNDLMID